MKIFFGFSVLFFLMSCHKDEQANSPAACNMQEVYSVNSKKVTITNGVWGTVSSLEGDCMPTVPACSSCCRNCPVQRTVRIYQYTTLNATIGVNQHAGFYDGFTTQLIAEVDADGNGFFQANLAPGIYSIVIVENGKLYANSIDGQGGLNSLTVEAGRKNVNLAITYKATF